jgi:hypothetical protein
MKKNQNLENIFFHYLKDEIDILSNNSLSTNISLPDEEMVEIKNLKNNFDSLIDIIVSLKKENINIQKQLTEITIECNKFMRSNSK